MKTKWYEVEIKGTTYRSYEIKAESKERAEEMALDAVDEDWEISKEWKQSAEVESCDRFKIDKDGVKIIG
ncbi:MAG: hypothetical protein CME70_05660 [Halobacteriovorax sp.]|nr:hypothetical protein [Halobacteriovorax sp.]|tara:strand:+ start:523 stop:732 length:210 start_codon:yes stop_codon:yes gene_type:complete